MKTRDQRVFKIFISIVFVVFAWGTFIALLATINTIEKQDLFQKGLCLYPSCVVPTLKLFSDTALILESMLKILVGIATIGGIFVALIHYTSSMKSTAITNHLEHFNTFGNFIETEVDRLPRLAPSSINKYRWYNLAFENSRKGSIEVGEKYKRLMREISQEIIVSNEKSERASQGSFKYKHHQERMISQFSKLGIELSFRPRNDFFETEVQLLELIKIVNNEFCFDVDIPVIPKAKYR